jgi:hypothetical protein
MGFFIRIPLFFPSSQVRHQDILSKTDFRFDENDPASGATPFAKLVRRSYFLIKGRRSIHMLS